MNCEVVLYGGGLCMRIIVVIHMGKYGTIVRRQLGGAHQYGLAHASLAQK